MGNRTEVGSRRGVPRRTILRTRRTITFATTVGGFCPELKVYWTYDLNPVLSRLLKSQTVTKEEDAITINLLELGHDGVRDSSHSARQASHARRPRTIEGGQRGSRVID